MTYQATRSVTIHPTHGRDFTIVTGQVLTQAQYNKLTARQQKDYTTPVIKTTARVPYTVDEAIAIVGLYVATKGDEKLATATYLDMTPDCKHSPQSIRQAMRQLSAIDPSKPGDTKWVAKTIFITTALDIAPDYFDPRGHIQDAYDLAN